MFSKDLIYLDNASTTKVDKRVIDEMILYMSDGYGNASSSHKFGTYISRSIEIARQSVAELINANTNEIFFSSGATESINAILKSTAKNIGVRNKIITIGTEHLAVLDTCNYLEHQGVEIIYAPIKSDGIIDIEVLRNLVAEDVMLVCIMLVNNETGVIQPIKEITKIAHQFGAFMMTDATQAVGKFSVDVKDLGVDFMAFSGHKFYGPKGIGGMFVKSSIKDFTSLLHGGQHEKGKRSGTLNVPGIIGIGMASRIAKNEMQEDQIRITSLRNLLESELVKIPGSFVNGSIEQRIFNISNIYFPDTEAILLIKKLENISVSNGSACTASLLVPSHVLKAMGKDDNVSFSSIRFSLGKYNTKGEILYTIQRLKELLSN